MARCRLLGVVLGMAFAAAATGAAAQTGTAISRSLTPDRSVAQERKLYAKLHIEERFGITFRPYASLCAPGTPSRVTCFAKIITDDSGTPLTFDPAKQDLPGYSPQQLRTAYGVSGIASGQPIIGIVDAYGDPHAIDDLKAYSKQFNLPVLPKCKGAVAKSATPCIQVVDQNGGTNYPAFDASWAGEQSLDLDMAHALCENCSILLVEANTNGLGDMLTAEQTAAKAGVNTISDSWGTAESSGETGADSSFLTYPGVVITAATGDHGYAGGVIWPAASPNAVAVGGTSLFLSRNSKKHSSEVAWAGTGSGCSQYEARPSWQPSRQGCANNRTVSDISVDADPNPGVSVYDSNQCNAGKGDCWIDVGGTSMSAPIVAAMYMLAGGAAVNNTQAADVLYKNASKHNLHDITSGSNGTCAFAYLCNAVPGYDGPTGLGTPKGLSVFIAPQ